ncbi:unnamed protein product [Schistosoma rodhaini]|uniref:Uncharacterized protein n=2 Tax=Schistosoma rodhaini TaxID=6188 RepID=A0AA85EV96_9TREM|nr:unnamed protein product [Schistosoma rodhaini]
MTFQKDKAIYSGSKFTKKSITKQQFTQELTARLEQLSSKREIHETDEYSETSLSPSSSISSFQSSVSSPRNSFMIRTNRFSLKDSKFTKEPFNDLQKANRIYTSSKNTKPCQQTYIKPKSLQQSKEKKRYDKPCLANEINSSISTQDNYNYSKNKYIQTNQMNKTIDRRDFPPKIMLKSCESRTQYPKEKEEFTLINENILQKPDQYDVSVGQDKNANQISDQSDNDDELGCLEDDTVIIGDNESAVDMSDSDASCTRRLSNIPEEILPPVIASLLPNTPSVLRFVDGKQTVPKFPKPYRYQLLWRPSAITPNVVKRILKRSNFRITLKSNEWIGYYGNHLKPFGFRPIREYQKINHFPGSFQLGRKDKLWINLNQLRSRFGKKSIDFVPRTFCLPGDLKSLKEFWTHHENTSKMSSNDEALFHFRPRWIMKPPASARGIGVKLIRGWSDIPKQRRVIVQSYINQPYLIDGKKFDIRLYVFVAGFSPLRAYVYREGLVRFASQKYSTSVQQLRNRFVHLTNYSVNKYNKTEETFASNHKWKLSTLWSYLTERGADVLNLWSRIVDIIFKTLSSVVSCIATMVDQNCRRRASVYELFGFDIILDADLKPWLLEVNVSPSLHTNTQLDDEVKTAVVKDMFNICGFQLPPDYHSSLSVTTIQSRSLNSVHYQPNKDKNLSETGRITPESILLLKKGDQSSMSRRNNNDINYSGKLSNQRSCNRSSISVCNSSAPLKPLMSKGISSIKGLPPPSPSINNTHTKRSLSAVSVKTTFCKTNNSLLNNNNSNNNNRIFVDPCIPITDPRLWDISLSAEDKRKHIFYTSLMTDKEKDKSTQFFNRLSKHNMKNSTTTSTTAENFSKDPLDILRHILLELSPDDLRTLVNLIDERYRAALGNFQCIFPVHGSKGYQMLTFLQGAYQENTFGGTLGSRSPSFYYYDILQYVFLTVYHNSEGNDNLSCDSFVHFYYDKLLPDQIALVSNELNTESLSIAGEMTGVSIAGLKSVINLCKKAIHLKSLDSPLKSSQFFKTQGDTNSKTSNCSSNKIDRREYHKLDDSTSLRYHNDSSVENQCIDLNNIKTIVRTDECSNQTQTMTQYIDENNDEYMKQQYKPDDESDSHNKYSPSSSVESKIFQSSVRRESTQPNIQSNNKNFLESTLSVINDSTDLNKCSCNKTCITNAVMNTKYVNTLNNTLKESSLPSEIPSDTKQTNISSVQIQTPNWNENAIKSFGEITCTSNNYQTLSRESHATRNMKPVRYSASSSLSSSSITAVVPPNTSKFYGYQILERMNSERVCKSPDEMNNISTNLYKDNSHINQRIKMLATYCTNDQFYNKISNKGTINNVNNKRQMQKLISGYQNNKYTDNIPNNHRLYHRIKSTSTLYPIRSYSQDRILSLNNLNHGKGSFEDVSMSSGYSSFVRDKLNSSFRHLALEMKKAQISS